MSGNATQKSSGVSYSYASKKHRRIDPNVHADVRVEAAMLIQDSALAQRGPADMAEWYEQKCYERIVKIANLLGYVIARVTPAKEPTKDEEFRRAVSS